MRLRKSPRGQGYLRSFWTHLEPYKRPLRAVYGLYLLNSVLNLVPAYAVRYYIDLVLVGDDSRLFGVTLRGFRDAGIETRVSVSLVFLLCMVLLIVAANTVGVVMWRLGTRSAERVLFDIKVHVHNHINKLSLGYFNSERVGSVMTKAVGDVTNLGQFLRGSFSVTYQIVQVVLAPVLMLSLSPLLFTVMLLPLSMAVYAFHAIRVRLKPMYREQREHVSQINSQMQEVVSGIKEIKAYNMAEKSEKLYSDVNWQFYSVQNRIMKVFSFNHQLQYGSRDLAMILVATVGGICMFRGVEGVTVGVIASFIALSHLLYGPLNALISFFDTFQQGMVSLERIIDFLALVPDVKDSPRARELKRSEVKGRVVYENVTFSYQPGNAILRDISFAVDPGDKVAIVGPSGSGKSTLLSLLLRFYDVDSGRILLDGHDIVDFTQESLRRHIGIVFQDTFLFYGSVRDNLLYVSQGKTEEDMVDACRIANIHDTIMELPDRFDTMVGERGVKLSGGQKQRLAIARVFLKDPAIVILDEATSAVDTVTESKIQESIERMLRDRTAFIIAHRLSTIQKCDKIIALQDGRIAETGTHAELLSRPGVFRQLHESNRI